MLPKIKPLGIMIQHKVDVNVRSRFNFYICKSVDPVNIWMSVVVQENILGNQIS